MKKLKFGFTVVEMITAMAIVGVTAAFVIPMTVKSFNKHQYGIVLGKAVQQIINGNQSMIQLANMNSNDGRFSNDIDAFTEGDLYPNVGGQNNLRGVLNNVISPFWGVSSETNLNDIQIRDFNNNVANGDVRDAINDHSADDPHVFKFNQIPASVALVNNNTWFVYIDVTGIKNPPNTFGKDIFGFELLNDGTLRPFNDDARGNGFRFTERIIRDNFRITYY